MWDSPTVLSCGNVRERVTATSKEDTTMNGGNAHIACTLDITIFNKADNFAQAAIGVVF